MEIIHVEGGELKVGPLRNKNTKHSFDSNLLREQTWLAEFYKTANQANTAEKIYPLISGIADLMKAQDYKPVDQMLSEVRLDMLSITAMVAMVRTTFPARHKLKHWTEAVNSIRESLSTQGLDATKFLHGLR